MQVQPDKPNKEIEKRNLHKKEKQDDDSESGSEKMSLSRGISLYRADSSINSSSSTMRGTRWSFSQKIEDDGRTHFINIPCDNIK